MKAACLIIAFLSVFALISGCSILSKNRLSSKPSIASVQASRFNVLDANDRMTSRELLGLLTAFVDTYSEQIMETVDSILAEKNISPQQRAFFTGLKTYYITAAINNVTHTSVDVGLLDMVTMVRLQHMLWAEKISQERYGDFASRMLAQRLASLEASIWNIAAKVLRTDQIDDLKQLIRQWRESNPNAQYVSFIRFQDFAPSRMKEALDEVILRGGFLAPVSDASHELHETRMLAERSMIWLKRLPMLLQLHGTLLGFDALSLPETHKMLGDIQMFVSALKGIQTAVVKLPDSARTVRMETLVDLDQKLTAQQDMFFKQMRSMLESERLALLASMENHGPTLGKMAADMDSTARNLLLVSQSIERMAGPAKDPSMPQGPGGDGGSLKAFGETVQGLNELAQRLDSLTSKTDIRSAALLLGEFENALQSHERRLALYAVGLLALAFVFGLVIVHVARRKR